MMVNESPYHEHIFSGPNIMLLCIFLFHETGDRDSHYIVLSRIKPHCHNCNIVVRQEAPISTVKVKYFRFPGMGFKPDNWKASI